MQLSDIRHVLILGAGTMGQQIGLICAMHGYDVVMYDISMEILDKALKRMEKLCSWFGATGRIASDQLPVVMARISATADPAEAAREVDIVSESVPEDPEIKARTFAQFHELCPERAVFTTNTSMLVPSMFADRTGRPEKLVALHFHDLRFNNVVDVMPHPGTDPAVTQLVRDFAASIGQNVIMLQKESNGYVFNAMLTSLFHSALSLASRNISTIEDIDRAWMGVMHAAIGPFGIMDQVGLVTAWTITDYWARQTGDEQTRANADFLKAYVDKGLLGYKSGEGFYKYPHPAYGQAGFLTGEVRAKKPGN